MDTIDAYLVARCLLLAAAHLSVDDLDRDDRTDAYQDAADLLDLLAEVLREAANTDGAG